MASKSNDATPKVENIFLFIPNLIGQSTRLLHVLPHQLIPPRRLLPCGPRWRFPLLHVLSSALLHSPLRNILSPRRPRWVRCAAFQPSDQVRGSAGHGDGPLYNGMFTVFFEQCVYEVGDSVPGVDFTGPGESLYAHVCQSG